MQLFTALFSALALISSVTASPAAAVIRRSEDIVFTPQITEPNSGTIWVAGTTQEVMWDTSRIPKSGENYTGTLMLGFDNGTGSENLNYTNPIATGFPLKSGSKIITVPNVPPRSTYFVVLIGDSGNRSPNFIIEQ